MDLRLGRRWSLLLHMERRAGRGHEGTWPMHGRAAEPAEEESRIEVAAGRPGRHVYSWYCSLAVHAACAMPHVADLDAVGSARATT